VEALGLGEWWAGSEDEKACSTGCWRAAGRRMETRGAAARALAMDEDRGHAREVLEPQAADLRCNGAIDKICGGHVQPVIGVGHDESDKLGQVEGTRIVNED
jgi:hypothetical protein